MTGIFDREEIVQQDIEKLIELRLEESIDLEFKRADEISVTNENVLNKLSVIVTSFANTVGGYLVYGIDTKRRKARELNFIKDQTITPDIIQKHLSQRIQKKLDGLKVHRVIFDHDESKSVIVICVPESRYAPHMAYDNRYYKRHQYKEHVMLEHEVRQAYHKTTVADIEFFGLVNTGGVPTMHNGMFKEVNFYPKFMIRNISSAIEHHYKFELYIPSAIHDPSFSALQNHYSKNEGVYSVFSIPNRSPLFQEELATVVEAKLSINRDNFNVYDNESIIIKLYYSNGIKKHEYRIKDMFRYKQKELKYDDFVMTSLFGRDDVIEIGNE